MIRRTAAALLAALLGTVFVSSLLSYTVVPALGLTDQGWGALSTMLVGFTFSAVTIAAIYTCLVDGPRAFVRIWVRTPPR